jgi:hypothetical protein
LSGMERVSDGPELRWQSSPNSGGGAEIADHPGHRFLVRRIFKGARTWAAVHNGRYFANSTSFKSKDAAKAACLVEFRANPSGTKDTQDDRS